MTDIQLLLLVVAGALAALILFALVGRWYGREVDGLYDDDGEHL